jgi:hypothetical protein
LWWPFSSAESARYTGIGTVKPPKGDKLIALPAFNRHHQFLVSTQASVAKWQTHGT